MWKGLHSGVSHNEYLFNIQLIAEPYFVSRTGLGAGLKRQMGDSCQRVEEEPIAMGVWEKGGMARIGVQVKRQP